MRWVLMLFVVLSAMMGGEARAVVVMSERDGNAEVAWSDCGDRHVVFSGGTSAAEYTVTAAAGSAWTVPSAATVQHVRGPDLGGGTKGLLYSLRRSLQPNEQSTWLPTFNRYNGRGDVVAQSDIDGTTTWAASYQADGRRTAEAGTNVERHRSNCFPKATRDAASGLVFQAAFAAGRSKEEVPTGLLNEGFRYRDLETGTFISRDPLGFVDGPNVYCYVGQNPWSAFDPEGLRLSATGVTFDETESGDIAVNVRHAAGTLDRGGLMFDSHEERGAGMWTYMTLKRSTMESGHANGQLEHMRRAAIVQFDNWQNQYYEGGADAAKLGLINAMDFTGAGDAAYNGKSALEVAARIGVGGLSVAFGGAALGAMRGTYAAGSAAGAMGLASAGSDLVLQGGLGVVDAIAGNEVKPYSPMQTAGAFLGGAVVGKLAGGLGAAKSAVPKIRGHTPSLRNPAQVDQIKADMLAGKYRYDAPEGIISGVVDKNGVVHLTEGQPRMNAALEILEESGNAAHLNQLLDSARRGLNGRGYLVPGEAPAGSLPLPRRKPI